MVGKKAYMRGRSRSTRPVSKRPPNWVIYQPDEVKALIINLAREGKPQSLIGNILRDQHGIPLVKPIVGYGIQRVLQPTRNPPSQTHRRLRHPTRPPRSRPRPQNTRRPLQPHGQIHKTQKTPRKEPQHATTRNEECYPKTGATETRSSPSEGAIYSLPDRISQLL